VRSPALALELDASAWDRVIRLARTANVLARIAEALSEAGQLEQVAPAPRQHLLAALTLASRQRIAGIAEIERVREVLAAHGLRCVLLKGAAYLAAGLSTARGRLYGDIDLLFHRDQLAEVESALMLSGWSTGTITPYDDRYYRQWMHELPPFSHRRRDSTLDIHHNILPLTARHPPDARLLLDAAKELPHMPGIWVLTPADMVVHSACHLFHEGEFPNGLRDLADLHSLLMEFSAHAEFWDELVTRAQDLGLITPLHYALRYCHELLATPIPATVQSRVAALQGQGWRQPLMDALYRRALRPAHRLCDDRWSPLARHILYLRAHWLRMPPLLLALHLARKSWRSLTGTGDYAASTNQDA
jgi:hypothetical protein